MSDTRDHETPAVASIETIRASFPALRRMFDDRPVGYFDAPGGTQVPSVVAEAVVEQMLRHNANAHWAYQTSRELDEVLAASRATLADLVGGRSDEIVFGPNMTTLTFHIARGLGRTFEPGDEIVVTELDHMANVSPWVDLELERGVVVRTVPLDPETGNLDWEAFEASVSDRTRLVAVTAASNALGTIVDLPRARSLARSVSALLFVDAVHLAPHERINVATLGCDFLACSPYKFYGPHVGVLWGRAGTLTDVLPPKLAPAPGTRSERLDAALAELSRRGDELIARLWEGLGGVSGVRLYGPPPGAARTPTLSFTIEGYAPAEAAARLSSDWGLFLSHGNFYASSVTARLDVEPEGLLRAGCACYTNHAEVERLIEAVGTLAAGG
jgi:selenocysteine lyase/cysteine desulfurase